MDNKRLLNQAIKMLQSVNAGELEAVQIDNTEFDDGSVRFTVELDYLAPSVECKEVIKPEISA